MERRDRPSVAHLVVTMVRKRRPAECRVLLDVELPAESGRCSPVGTGSRRASQQRRRIHGRGVQWLGERPDDNPKLSLKDSNIWEEFRCREDGYARHVVINKKENVKDTTECTDVLVAANWESVPEFGRYESIARWEHR